VELSSSLILAAPEPRGELNPLAYGPGLRPLVVARLFCDKQRPATRDDRAVSSGNYN